MNSLHYTHVLSHCWLPDNSPGIGSNSGLQKKNLVLIHFIINTCVVVVAAAAQQHVWQEKCCFSKAQLEIFSTFQHKARVITFFFSHGLDGLCCCSMQVDNATNTFMLILLFWRLKVHCVVLGRLCFCMTKQTLFSWVNRLNKTDWPWRKTQFHTVTLKVDRWQGPPFTNVVLGILFSSQISLFIQLQEERCIFLILYFLIDLSLNFFSDYMVPL